MTPTTYVSVSSDHCVHLYAHISATVCYTDLAIKTTTSIAAITTTTAIAAITVIIMCPIIIVTYLEVTVPDAPCAQSGKEEKRLANGKTGTDGATMAW